MKKEFLHRGIRATISSSSECQVMWSVFPIPRVEITDTVTATEAIGAAKLAVARACDEIDDWMKRR